MSVTAPLSWRSAAVGLAVREGEHGPCADAAAHYLAADLTMAVAVVHATGTRPEAARLAPLLAESAVRAAAQRGALAGVLHAALAVSDPGPEGDGPDATIALAVRRADGHTTTAWAGECRVWSWDGTALTLHSTGHDHSGVRPGGTPAAEHGVTLAQATPALVGQAVIPAGRTLVLATPGLHRQLAADTRARLTAAHVSTPQRLADALSQAATATPGTARADAAVLVLS
ncbi:hypothetical protein [Streptomyces sp. NPDC049879]|uniref:hypothetical protein n=1 Tax=Streptomyces sp. NPDC049879 TaxID=3365598 RepID=UPI003792FE2F